MLARSLPLLAILLVSCQPKVDLPKLFPVPEAKLVDETGKAVNLSAMKGNVAVYDFIFTNCSGICPVMSNNMRALTAKVDKSAPVRFVSISIDPTRDTPPVLAAYAKRVRNDARWTFVTGERDAIVDLSVKGFKLTAGDPMPGGDPLLHSSRFAVADKEGVIRAYYDVGEGDAPEKVARIIEQLLEE
jgi:protein SCO1